ncbi:MAG: glycosyltransferase family 2 protein [Helicobacter sp.]|nr:glycosyltransferase family 2 protein [Helicobacteraceae bacterium]MDY3113726.1 glycosyltransferase family 2 protein [Helicobacter sp.]
MGVKVSIILPIFNVERYIRQCLESCVNQTFRDIEIICVDDCGGDYSMDIVREFAHLDKRIKIVKNPKNLGLFAARLAGAKVALGEYLFFLDSDDLLKLDALEKISDFFGKDRVSVGINRLIEDRQEAFFSWEDKEFLTKEAFIKYQLGSKYPKWNLVGNLVKKEIYLKAFSYLKGDLKITMAEDALTSFVLANLCETTIYKKEPLYLYRVNLDSISNVNKERE